jgi:Multidrug resistance efflux pump
MTIRYFLGEKASSTGAFNFLGLGPKDGVAPKSKSKSVPPKEPMSKIDTLAKVRQNAEEKKRAALEAAEARRKQAEERKAAADAKRREAQEKLQASIAARRDAEAKRQAQKLVSSSSGGTISLGALTDKKKDVKSAEKLISSARPGATISLGLMGFGQKKEPSTSPSSASTGAPPGVPNIRKWSQNRDGSISGFIYGSPAFKDGESITTSPIRTKNPAEKSVVTTISGSK